MAKLCVLFLRGTMGSGAMVKLKVHLSLSFAAFRSLRGRGEKPAAR
jgi:hypothetical protein